MLNRKIAYFISVVENGSFSGAAKKLFVSQSAISQQIIQLEDELGIYLFDRSGYRPVLTDCGNYYYQHCKELMDNYEEIVAAANEIANQNQRVLKIGVLGPLEKKHLPKIVKQYKKKYNDVCIDIKKITFGDGVNQLKNYTLDIAFGIINEFQGKDEIYTVNLLKHRVCVVCSKSHSWANREHINSIEIADQPIISFSKNIGEKFFSDFMESFKKDGITPNIVQSVNELEELLLAVKINQGIALVSKEVIEKEDEVCTLDIENTHHHADFCLGYLKKNEKVFLNAFVNYTADYFNALTL